MERIERIDTIDLSKIYNYIRKGIIENIKIRHLLNEEYIEYLQNFISNTNYDNFEELFYLPIYKDVERLKVLLDFINGYYCTIRNYKSKRMIKCIKNKKYYEYGYLIYYFIVNNQIFGDGNHRTAYFILNLILKEQGYIIPHYSVVNEIMNNRNVDYTTRETNFYLWTSTIENIIIK